MDSGFIALNITVKISLISVDLYCIIQVLDTLYSNSWFIIPAVAITHICIL